MNQEESSKPTSAPPVGASEIDRRRELLRRTIGENWTQLRKTAYNFLDEQIKYGNLPVPENTQKLATDIATAASLKVLESAEEFDPNREPLPWIIGWVKKQVLAHGRDEKRDYERQQNPKGYSEVSVSGLRPRDIAEKDWSEDEIFGRLKREGRDPDNDLPDRDGLHYYLQQLKEQDRRILKRRYFDNVMVKEMAIEDGISENAMGVRLHRARGRLRDLIEEGE